MLLGDTRNGRATRTPCESFKLKVVEHQEAIDTFRMRMKRFWFYEQRGLLQVPAEPTEEAQHKDW